jgi:ABC-type nitrate/sulfonate/bicarbonate transport system permease component
MNTFWWVIFGFDVGAVIGIYAGILVGKDSAVRNRMRESLNEYK